MLNKFRLQWVAGLLASLLLLDPTTAAGLSQIGHSPSSSAFASALSRRNLYQQQALMVASNFILKPALIARQYSARVFDSLPQPTPDQWVFGGIAVSWAATFVSPYFASLLIGVSIAWLNPTYEQDLKRRHNRLWRKFTDYQRVETYHTRHFPIEPDSDFMQKNWGGPQDLDSIQTVTYKLIEQLLKELERQVKGDDPHVRLKRAEEALNHFLECLRDPNHGPGPRIKVFEIQEDDPEINPASLVIATYKYPDPYILKPLLIRLQAGKILYPDLTDEARIKQIIRELVQARDNPAPKSRELLGTGFPVLPISLEARKALLSDYLAELAEHPGSPYDLRKIAQVLDSPELDLKNLPENEEQELVMDPYSWKPLLQQADPLGVLPRSVAEAVGATQMAWSAFVQLGETDRREETPFALMVRARDKNEGGTGSIPSGKTYLPNSSPLDTLKQRVADQFGFRHGSELEGEWELVKAIDPPVYGGKEGRDIQLLMSYVYYPTPAVAARIDENRLRLEDWKTEFEGPEEFENELTLNRHQDGINRYDTRAVFYLLRFDMVNPVHQGGKAGLYKAGSDKTPESKPVMYTLEETFRGGRKVTTPISPSRLIMRLLRDEDSPTYLLLSGRRSVYEKAYKDKEDEIRRLKHTHGPKAVRSIHLYSRPRLMQSRFEQAHGRYGGVMEIVAAVVESFDMFVLGQPVQRWLEGHKERVYLPGENWIDQQHPMYTVTLDAVEEAGRIMHQAISPLSIGRYGRFVAATLLHIWLSSLKPRLQNQQLRLRYFGFSA